MSRSLVLAHGFVPPVQSPESGASREHTLASIRAAAGESVLENLRYLDMLPRKTKGQTPLPQPEQAHATLRSAGYDLGTSPPSNYADVITLLTSFRGTPRFDLETFCDLKLARTSVTRDELARAVQFAQPAPQSRKSAGLWRHDLARLDEPSQAKARPPGWTVLETEPAERVGSPAMPKESGWYLIARSFHALPKINPFGEATHSGIGYYDAQAKQWLQTSGFRPYTTNVIPQLRIAQEDEAHDSDDQDYFRLRMGPVALEELRDTPHPEKRWNDAIARDVVVLEASMRRAVREGKFRYNYFSSVSSGFDGTCNTYSNYVVKALGAREAFPYGHGVIGMLGSAAAALGKNGDVVIQSKPKHQERSRRMWNAFLDSIGMGRAQPA